jgi:phosphatidylglycerophosphate synthase
VTDRSFVTDSTRQRIRGWAVPVAVAMGRLGLSPNALTILGFLGTCAAAIAAASQAWALAGVLVLAFGIFDLFDGALARATGKASKFGAFLDSTLDRTGENLVYAGIAVGSAAAGFLPGTALAGLALAFASVVTYARARAEALGVHGEVGIAPRPERLIVLAGGLILTGLFGGLGDPSRLLDGGSLLALALLIISFSSAITVVQRILHVKAQLDRAPGNQ